MPAAICRKYGLAFYPIPKSASTSMKLVMYALQHGKPWTGDPLGVHPEFRTYPLEINGFDISDDLWKFTVIRDPIKRLLSCYGNRVIHHEDLKKKPETGIKLAQLNLPIDPSLDEFCCNLKAYQDASYHIWHHSTGVKTFIGSDLSRLESIYPIEQLSDLQEELRKRTLRKVTIPRVQTSGPKFEFRMLSEEGKSAVIEYTREDYEFLKSYYQLRI